MAGPCFTIFYKDDTILSKDKIAKLLESYTTIQKRENGSWEFWLDTTVMPEYKTKKGKKESTGMLLLFPNEPFKNICNEEKIALTKTLGFVPQFAWSGCAMCKDEKDIDALYFLIDRLANAGGGYQKVDVIPDWLQNNEPQSFHKIEYRDYAAYFGPREKEIATEEKLKYHDFVELSSYYMVNLSETSFSHLDY